MPHHRLEGFWGMVGVEVGKHVGDLQAALPLRAVCKEWAGTVALGAPEAELDLAPDAAPGDAERRDLFYRRCPFVTRLTYHVAPGVTLAKFEAVLAEAGSRLPRLESLSLAFNNGAQRLGTRHLAAVAAALPRLRELSLRADFEAPEACDFGALAPLAALRELRVAPSDACTGLADGHASSLGGLAPSVERLEFPGAARGFTGATLGALARLPRLARLAVLPPKPAGAGGAGGGAAVEYALEAPAALDAVAALASRRGPGAPPLDLELGVPEASWVPRLLAAGAAHLGRLSASVREAAGGAQVSAIAAAPGAARALVGLDLAFGGAPEPADLAAIAAGLPALERLTITSKCVRPPSARLDVAAALAPLARLRSLHLHINPQWRAPLSPEAVAGLAAALPALERLHLRLGGADHAACGLGQLFRFSRLRALSLQWLGDDPPAGGGCAGGRGGRRASLEAPVLNLGSLPRGLEELALTSISAVRLAPPAPYDPAYMAAPPLGALRALSLDGNFGLSDALLPALAAQLPALASLSLVLAGRQALGGAGLAAAAAALPAPGRLASLVVTDYREGPLALDQGCLDGLAAALPRLRLLKLSTPDIVRAALRPEAFSGFSRLRRLDLVGCQDLAAAALAGALPLCCCKPGPAWAGDEAAATAAEAAPAAA